MLLRKDTESIETRRLVAVSFRTEMSSCTIQQTSRIALPLFLSHGRTHALSLIPFSLTSPSLCIRIFLFAVFFCCLVSAIFVRERIVEKLGKSGRETDSFVVQYKCWFFIIIVVVVSVFIWIFECFEFLCKILDGFFPKIFSVAENLKRFPRWKLIVDTLRRISSGQWRCVSTSENYEMKFNISFDPIGKWLSAKNHLRISSILKETTRKKWKSEGYDGFNETHRVFEGFFYGRRNFYFQSVSNHSRS